jgi:hypothetical protein
MAKEEYESLEMMFRMMDNEAAYKIQIITLEALETFEGALRGRGITYIKQFTSSMMPSPSPVILIRDIPTREEIRTPPEGRYLLYSNVRERGFIQIVFRATLEEKMRILGDEFLVRSYSYKNVAELRAMKEGRKLSIVEHYRDSLDYYESVIIFVMLNRRKFKEILQGVREVNEELSNSFLLQLKLNGLVQKLFILRNGDSYRINVSMQAVKVICAGIGFGI